MARVKEDLQIWARKDEIGLGDFKRLGMLGKSCHGTVYLVRLTGTRELYAMKELSKGKMVEENRIQRVLTEREILATAHHPCVVTCYASFQTDTHLYFILEWCEGGMFFNLLKKRGRLSEEESRFYVAEVILGLEYLHFLGFIYRDLKPENVLLSKTGHIRLTDFDLSKKTIIKPDFLIGQDAPPKASSKSGSRSLRGSSSVGSGIRGTKNPSRSSRSTKTPARPSRSTKTPARPSRSTKTPARLSRSTKTPARLSRSTKTPTRGGSSPSLHSFVPSAESPLYRLQELETNSFVGTSEYVAPEIISGIGHSSLVDWWSLGIFTYECLVGQTPFKGSTQGDTFRKILKGKLRFPKNAKRRTSKHCRSFVKKCLHVRKEDRLGAKNGVAEIKGHPWFSGVRWSLLVNRAPPISPEDLVGLGVVRQREVLLDEMRRMRRARRARKKQGQPTPLSALPPLPTPPTAAAARDAVTPATTDADPDADADDGIGQDDESAGEVVEEIVIVEMDEDGEYEVVEVVEEEVEAEEGAAGV